MNSVLINPDDLCSFKSRQQKKSSTNCCNAISEEPSINNAYIPFLVRIRLIWIGSYQQLSLIWLFYGKLLDIPLFSLEPTRHMIDNQDYLVNEGQSWWALEKLPFLAFTENKRLPSTQISKILFYSYLFTSHVSLFYLIHCEQVVVLEVYHILGFLHVPYLE